MGKYKHYKGSIGGGVDISGKSKMSGKAKSLMSFPGGMPGPGEYGKIVGKGMMKYMAGEPVGMAKYKSKGPKKPKPDYIDIDGDGNKTESMKEASDGMGKYKKGPHKESQDHKMAYDRSEISRLKKDIHYDDLKKKGKK